MPSLIGVACPAMCLFEVRSCPMKYAAASDDQLVDRTTSALALSYPLHRLEPYCTCVWLDPLVVASGPDLPPMQALPMSEDDAFVAVDLETPNFISRVQQPVEVKVKAAYILATEPVDTDRQNVADSQDGARILFANPCVSFVLCTSSSLLN